MVRGRRDRQSGVRRGLGRGGVPRLVTINGSLDQKANPPAMNESWGTGHTIRTALAPLFKIQEVQTLSSDRSTALLCKDINIDAEDDYHIQEETEAAVACDHVHAVILS